MPVESLGDDPRSNGIEHRDSARTDSAGSPGDDWRERAVRLAAVGEISAAVAHEVNNPLGAIVSIAHVLFASPPGHISEDAREDVRLILHEANRASGILKGLLSASRPAADKRETFRVSEIVKKVVAVRKYSLQNEGVRLDLRVSTDLPEVQGDRDQIESVVLNLVLNAERAMRGVEGGRLSMEATETGRTIRLSVRDSGRGIPPDVLPNIFKPFWTTRADGQGTGLGLAICASILREHGGSIKASSTREGAEFVVALPCAPERQRPDARSGASGERARVLIVDDEPLFRLGVSKFLDLTGRYDVAEAADGAEARARILSEPYAAVVVDMRMPAMNGPGLWDAICLDRPALRERVVFMTGDDTDPAVLAFLLDTGRPYIGKPFDPARLDRLIRDIPAVRSVLSGST